MLSLASAASAQLVNVALSGTASYGTIYDPIAYTPNYVNDGNVFCGPPSGAATSAAITGPAPYPWISIDLGLVFTVSNVTIFGRPGYLADQGSPLGVFVGSNPANGGLANPTCASNVAATLTGATATACGGSVGRYVTVQLQAFGSANYLRRGLISSPRGSMRYALPCSNPLIHLSPPTPASAASPACSLCEIQVWAQPPAPPPPFSAAGLALTNLALAGTAVQSVTYIDGGGQYRASFANDGNTVCGSGDDPTGFSIAAQQNNPWWQVDLGASFVINTVTLYGRNSRVAQSGVLSVFVLNVSSDVPLGTGSQSVLCDSRVDAPSTGARCSRAFSPRVSCACACRRVPVTQC